MDLLGGYGSDSDSDSDSGSTSQVPAIAIAPRSILKPSRRAEETQTLQQRQRQLQKKRGRKILKLNSVLPPEILERLTRSALSDDDSSGDGSDDGSDDNDSNGNGMRGMKDMKGMRGVRGKARDSKADVDVHFHSHSSDSENVNVNGHSEDVGIHSLLTDLKDVRPTPTPNNDKNQTENKQEKAKERMGMAFMKVQVSSAILRKDKRGTVQHDVVDIHGLGLGLGLGLQRTNTNAPTQKQTEETGRQIIVEDVMSGGSTSEEDHEHEHDKHKHKHLQPQQLSQHQPPTELFPSTVTATATATTAIKKTTNRTNAMPVNETNHPRYSTANATTYTVHSGIATNTEEGKGRGMGMGIEPPTIRPVPPSSLSAGFIKNATSSTTTTTQAATKTTSSLLSQPIPSIESQSHTQSHTHTHTQQPQISHKRSKRELERALRSGNFDAIQSRTHKIESLNYNTHQGQGQGQAHGVLSGIDAGMGMGMEAMGSGSGSYGTGGGLETYAPTEGTAVSQKGYTSKQKGKNQIHSLVSSAAKLEADQRRIAAMSSHRSRMGGGPVGGKSKRADAKRKYGW